MSVVDIKQTTEQTNMEIYKVSRALAEALDDLGASSNGVLPPPDELFAHIKQVAGEFEKVLPDILGIIKNKTANSAMLEAEASNLSERAKREKDTAASLKGMLVKMLPEIGSPKGTAGLHKYAIQNNGGQPALRYTKSDAELMEKYPMFVRTPEPVSVLDKAEITAALMQGAEGLEDFTLYRGKHIVIK